MNSSEEISIRHYFERLMDERDRQCDGRMDSLEKLMGATFAASEKAIVKAETAQREYNERSNEFRGQLDDQAKLLLPKAEAAVLFRVIDEKIEALRQEISALREYRSGHTGIGSGRQQFWGWVTGAVALIVSLFTLFEMFKK